MTRPWLFRRLDAGQEKRLGAPKASHRRVKLVPKIDEVVRGAVRQFAMGVSPNELRRVELRCVRGEVVAAQPRMLRDEDLNVAMSMGATAIPQKIDHAKREALLHQMQRILPDQVTHAPVYHLAFPTGLGPRVEDITANGISGFYMAPYEDLKLKRP
jgi:hypothetical protein